MSFILDALKRAERERRLERPPDLSVVYQEGDQPRHSRWSWFSGGLAFLTGAVVVALLLWPKAPPPEVSKAPEPAKVITSSAPDRERSLGDRPGPSPVPAQKIASREGVTSSQPKPPAPSKTVPQPERQQAKETEVVQPEPVVSGDKAPTSRPSEPTTSRPPETPPAQAVAAKSPATTEPPKSMPLKPSDISQTPHPTLKEKPPEEPVEAFPLLKDLPEEVRQKLGKLEINVHAYSKDPAERLVFINMRKYRVGDRIGKDGPVLKKIIPDGVIVDYGEGKARLLVRK